MKKMHPTPDTEEVKGADDAVNDELGEGSRQLENEVRARIKAFENPKWPVLGTFGSAFLTLFFGLISSILYPTVLFWGIGFGLMWLDFGQGVDDFLWEWTWYVVLGIGGTVFIIRAQRVESIMVEEGQKAFLSLFDGWLLRWLIGRLQIGQGEHLQFLSFGTIYALNQTIRAYPFSVGDLTCSGIGGVGTAPLGDGKGGDIEGNASLRLVDPLELIRRVGQEGVEGLETVVDEFLNNIVRDGLSPMHYDQVERADRRDRAIKSHIEAVHASRKVTLEDGDEVFLITGSGLAMTAMMIQKCLTNDTELLKSRSKASTAVGEAAALKKSHRALMQMAIDQSDRAGIETTMDPLRGAFAMNQEMDVTAFDVFGLTNARGSQQVVDAAQGIAAAVGVVGKTFGKGRHSRKRGARQGAGGNTPPPSH